MPSMFARQCYAIPIIMALMVWSLPANAEITLSAAAASKPKTHTKGAKHTSADTKSDKKVKHPLNRVTFGPLGLLVGMGSINYERHITDLITIELSPTGMYWGYSGAKLYGGSIGVGVGFYLHETAPQGLYCKLNTFWGGIVLAGSDSDSDENSFMFGVQAQIGYNWIWDNGLTIGLGGGLQYNYMKFSKDDDATAFNGVLPSLDFNIGFAF